MKKLLLAAAFACLGLAFTGTAFAKDLRVGNTPDCKNANFTTVQSAVTAANSGDKIKVCAGTYVEQVTIPAGKDKLSLEGEKDFQAIIQAPATMADPKAIVRVNGAQDVKIKGFTIQGPGGSGCDSIRWGVRVDGNGSATIEKNLIRHIRDQPFSGCQNGVGVLFGRSSEGQVGSGVLKDNLIDDYQKGGVVVSGDGSSAVIEHNAVFGAGPTAVIGQNGIQVSTDAVARIKDNVVGGNVYSPQTVAAAGLLLFNAGDTLAENNTVVGNDVGAYVIDSHGDVVVKKNDVSQSTYDGIAVTDAPATVEGNKLFDNDFGVGLYTVVGALVKGNDANDNRTDGFFADTDTSDNRFEGNKASGSGTFDCHDDSVGAGTAGTANFWLHDKGETASPPGICQD